MLYVRAELKRDCLEKAQVETVAEDMVGHGEVTPAEACRTLPIPWRGRPKSPRDEASGPKKQARRTLVSVRGGGGRVLSG